MLISQWLTFRNATWKHMLHSKKIKEVCLYFDSEIQYFPLFHTTFCAHINNAFSRNKCQLNAERRVIVTQSQGGKAFTAHLLLSIKSHSVTMTIWQKHQLNKCCHATTLRDTKHNLILLHTNVYSIIYTNNMQNWFGIMLLFLFMHSHWCETQIFCKIWILGA